MDRPPEVEELEAEGARIRPGRADEVHREGAAGRGALPAGLAGGGGAPSTPSPWSRPTRATVRSMSRRAASGP